VGADLVAGSLIKGVGGTLAVGGGYIAGRQPLVAACAARLTAPGIGIDSGCVSGETLRLMMQGAPCLFHSP
jgi:cystathionine beta-lyase family protein involved in aluminum resistance